MRKRNSRCRLPSFLCGYAPYAENHWLKTTTVPKAKRNISPRELYRKKRVQFIDNCNYSGLPPAQNQDVILCSKECFENMGCKCAGMRLGGGEAAGHSIPLRACIAQAPI